ncbi:glycosyltransferase family 4 protein [Trichocoleus sp. DQ-A3]|uniref:glycosyltransferase n=1 Tax=Cyanophyceae TaxID=3028117 RepID=UPI001689AE78|nr:glycosyltransferase family 4 protein [Coleofasciculus sp. FACHB-125]MBD2087559.1 glycosyltransferase family 4 protein [Coleofasciculus sp. FACHB-542]MBD2541132.1 glycosyltransferase family 4 protein [Coleofasciculus sp. FACHB-SPT36]
MENKNRLKILLVANTGWYLYNFRLPLARFLRLQGIEVVLVSPWDAYVERLEAEGFRWIQLRLSRRSINPLVELLTIAHLTYIYLREKPSAVHHFTIKCVLYGTIGAKLSRTRAVVNAVTGLGYIFISTEWKARILQPIIRFLYRQILTARRVRVVFQNMDDLQAFADRKLIVPDRTVLIRSSGVDLKRFSPRPSHPDAPPAPVVLFAARLLVDKGLIEYVEAARILKTKGVCATFQIAGVPDTGNPSSISETTLEQWRREGAVDLLGYVEKMENPIALSTVVVLPSYREGVPRILLEAAAMGKPLVATDVPGCREVVIPGENGFLVPVKNARLLANAIEVLLKDPDLCKAMGDAGREKVLREFDDQDVVRRTVKVYEVIGVRLSSDMAATEQ